MTRKRKWMMGLLALGVGALVMDRTLLGPPEQASASEAALAGSDAAVVPVEAEGATTQPGGQGATPAVDEPPDLSDFARRLETLPTPRGAAFDRADGFALPQEWVPQEPVAPSQAEEQVPERSLEAQMFLSQHRHNGTIVIPASDSGDAHEEDVYIAVVDGKRYFVGMELDGFRLVRVANGRSLWRHIETNEQLVLREVRPQ